MLMPTSLREGNSDDKPTTETITGHLAFAFLPGHNHGGLEIFTPVVQAFIPISK